MKIFFSHCSEDRAAVSDMVELIGGTKKGVKLFYSSDPDTGVDAGEDLIARINREVNGCNLFVPVITENYVRSIYCTYELSLAVFLKKNIVPVASSAAVYEKLVSIIGRQLLYIDASAKDGARIFANKFQIKDDMQRIEEALGRLAGQVRSTRPYIGMSREEYSKVLEYCDEQGIKRLQCTTMPSEEIKRKISQAKEIIIVSTTGEGLLKMLSAEALSNALAEKCDIKIVLPNQYSAFCRDVAEIESPNATEVNLTRLANEFNNVISYLNETVIKAKEKTQNIGTVTVYCAYTLLRQTVTLAKSEKSTWCWVTMTMPPKRTVDGTPSMEVECDNDSYGLLMNVISTYCNEIVNVAVRRKAVKEINGSTAAEPFLLEERHALTYWREKYKKAQERMQNAAQQGDGVLIEVAAQHPLSKGKYPGAEFTARLDLAVELYNKFKAQNQKVWLYVPGSRHKFGGVADEVSLSKAGDDYLAQKGVSPQHILGDSASERYKGSDGVYNSADECFVAEKLFGELKAATLVCVCSPFQSHRKILHYIEFGAIPMCYCVSADGMFHDIISEVFNSVPNVLYRDHSYQDKNGEAFINSRKERKV